MLKQLGKHDKTMRKVWPFANSYPRSEDGVGETPSMLDNSLRSQRVGERKGQGNISRTKNHFSWWVITFYEYPNKDFQGIDVCNIHTCFKPNIRRQHFLLHKSCGYYILNKLNRGMGRRGTTPFPYPIIITLCSLKKWNVFFFIIRLNGYYFTV